MNRAPRVFPIQPATVCPLCECKTVQHLQDGSSYCTRERCGFNSLDPPVDPRISWKVVEWLNLRKTHEPTPKTVDPK